MNNKTYKKTNCRLCNSKNLSKVAKFIDTPPGNSLIKKKNLNINQKKYPLELNFCNKCYHIQLSYVVDPKILYQQNYSYLTSISSSYIEYFRKFSKKISKECKLIKGSKIFEIGSNDGTALNFFKQNGYNVLGIDPAKNIASLANKKNIKTIPKFFSFDESKKIKKTYGNFDLITSHNVLAHIDNFKDVINGVYHLLKPNGYFVFEVGYFGDVFKKGYFDTIYHEHLDYHTLFPLVKFFKKSKMKIINAKRIKPQGGSIQLTIVKDINNQKINGSVKKILDFEKKISLNNYENLAKFQNKILKVKKQLNKILKKIKESNKSIIAYGAPTKATTLINYLEISKYIKFIVDDNILKQNLYLPITHIKILDPKHIYIKKPDFILILAWNFADLIISNHKKYLKNKGKFIIPLPKPKIIKK